MKNFASSHERMCEQWVLPSQVNCEGFEAGACDGVVDAEVVVAVAGLTLSGSEPTGRNGL